MLAIEWKTQISFSNDSHLNKALKEKDETSIEKGNL